MNKKLISLAIAGAVVTPLAAQAGSFTVGNVDINVSGGITGAYAYTSENATGNQDVFAVPDALLDFSSDAKTGGMGFDLGIGTLGENNLSSGGALTAGIGGTPVSTGGSSPSSVGVQYGWVAVKPINGLELDAGILATNVGYEGSPSYANDNFLRGFVWNAQPTYYTGARATYSMNGISVYGEVTKDPLHTQKAGGAIGASGDFSGIHGAVSYYTRVDNNTIFDIIASTKVSSVNVAANLDYITKAKAQKNLHPTWDDNAIGLALYASVSPMDKVTLPVRVEYLDDGTSGIYLDGGGVSNTGISFTITPTYNFTDNTFVRAELAYVTADKKVFVDDNGQPKDNEMILGVQGGVKF